MTTINLDRPLLVGPEVPKPPFPFALNGTVVKGYGRGSKELGIPTANLSDEAISTLVSDLNIGVYYGWVQIGKKGTEVYPMVMSLGWNPYYKNEKRSAEVHVIHEFSEDFYDADIRVLVLGYIRPEQNYPSLAALITDIKTDVEVANHSLQRKHYLESKEHAIFIDEQ
ncbi:Flavokinase-domain-containing protein [Backusella circina FSU 941]|nr:Flavokinase-domain-containing protein [Backusella circina FSU 941]